MKSSAILRDFVGEKCSSCGRTKQKMGIIYISPFSFFASFVAHVFWQLSFLV
jgi:hypothetical protein